MTYLQVRESLNASERRSGLLTSETDDLKSQVDGADRARKQVISMKIFVVMFVYPLMYTRIAPNNVNSTAVFAGRIRRPRRP